jgi:peptidyl-prolyl cis-trans isomerase A (cyclophilin A)
MHRYVLFFAFLLVVFSVSCAEKETEVPKKEEIKEVEPPEVKQEPEVKPPTEVEPPAETSGVNPALLDPSLAKDRAPDRFHARFDTTKGPFTVEVDRSLSPLGADRFFNLVKIGFFEDIALFRVLDGFVVQFGISGNPEINEKWSAARIKDEPVKASNLKAYITYAKGGKDTRTTQLFINLADNTNLDQMGFPPFGKVVEGMTVVESFFSGYGEGAPRGRGPSQGLIQSQGNKYLKSQFPKLDYIEKATILEQG